MNCIKCGNETTVVDTRPRSGGVIRRRKCGECGFRFPTVELVRTDRITSFLPWLKRKGNKRKGDNACA